MIAEQQSSLRNHNLCNCSSSSGLIVLIAFTGHCLIIPIELITKENGRKCCES